MPLSAGQSINNRYRIVRLLGKGGFGAVYRAWDTTFGIPCAVKENLDISQRAQRQFVREAKMLRTLKHPNLPLVTDYFVIPDQGQYLVMDYIEGEDLLTRLERSGAPLPETQVLSWIEQICDALTYLHSQTPPIIHRDIKPANIRITPDGNATLVDFGIAKVYDPDLLTTAGARAVTPGYSPLEQYGQGATDVRTDIYALGATLYHLLTGKQPPESIERVTGDTLESPERLNPGLSPNTVVAIRKAMQIQPKDRFRSAAQFKGTLQTPTLVAASRSQLQARTGSTVAVRQPPPPNRSPSAPLKRPKPWIWIVVAVSFVIGFLIIAGLLLWIANSGGNDPELAKTQTAFALLITRATSRAFASPTPQNTQRPSQTPALTDTPASTHTPVPSFTPSPTMVIPRITGFTFCDRPCDQPGAVSLTQFPARVEQVFMSFDYEGMSQGLRYSRVWTMEGEQWVRYDCVWGGPERGTYYLKLWDVDGLRSGTWVVTITIEGSGTFQSSVDIAGSYDFWDPAGHLPCRDW